MCSARPAGQHAATQDMTGATLLSHRLIYRHSAPERVQRPLLSGARLRHGNQAVGAAQVVPHCVQVPGCQRLAHARGRGLRACMFSGIIGTCYFDHVPALDWLL